MAGLLGAYPPIDVPEPRPLRALDGHNLHDATAREDYLLGALALRAAADEATAMCASDEHRRPTAREVRALEDKWAAVFWAAACTPHEHSDEVDSARIVALRQERAS